MGKETNHFQSIHKSVPSEQSWVSRLCRWRFHLKQVWFSFCEALFKKKWERFSADVASGDGIKIWLSETSRSCAFPPYWKVFSRWAAVGHLARERQRHFIEQKRKTSDWCSSLWRHAAQLLGGRRFWSRRRHSSKNSLLCVRPPDKQAQTTLTAISSNMCVSVSYNRNQMAWVCVFACVCVWACVPVTELIPKAWQSLGNGVSAKNIVEWLALPSSKAAFGGQVRWINILKRCVSLSQVCFLASIDLALYGLTLLN